MTSKRSHDRPNVIVVLLDTLRADHLSCYGAANPTSPKIDQIAQQATLYEKAISPAAWTPPAHASLFTGTFPSRHKVDRSNLTLGPELDPLPEVLQRGGYRTYGASSNYWLSRETSFDRGFDEFMHSWQMVQTSGTNAPLARQQRKQDLGLDTLRMPAEEPSRYAREANRLYEKATNKLRNRLQAYDDGAWRVVRQARRWMSEWAQSEQPFFAFLHFMEPHIRYSAPGSYHLKHMPRGVTPERAARVNQDPWRFLTGQTEMTEEDFAILAGLYDGEISYVDSRIGELHQMLTDSGVMENTVFVITSDHGENLGEHGLMDHAYCLYDTLVNVPLIIQGPEGFPAGHRVGRPVQSASLFGTILRLAGLEDDSAWGQIQARDPLFATDVALGSAEDRYTFAEYREPQPPLAVLKRRFDGFDGAYFDRSLRMIRNDSHKFIWTSDGCPELYDLKTDPGETKNLANVDRDRAETMAREMEGRLGSFEAPELSEPGLDLDDDTVKKLEQLGYLA